MTPEEVVKKYLGVPYLYKGRDPKVGLDCWGLGVCIFKDLGIELLDFEIDYREGWGTGENENYFIENYWKQWDMIDHPRAFDCVLFRSLPEAMPNHGGVMLGEHKFIHASRQAGVTVGDIRREVLQRLKVGYFRHKDLKL